MTLRVTQQVVEVLIVNATGGAVIDEDISTTIGIVSTADIVSPLDDSLTTVIGLNIPLTDSGVVDEAIKTTIGFDLFAGDQGDISIKTTIGVNSTIQPVELESLTTSIGFTLDTADNFATESITTSIGFNLQTIDDVGGDLSIFIKTEIGVANDIIVSQDESLTTEIGFNLEAFERIFLTTSIGVNDTLDAALVQPPIDSSFGIINTISVQTEENISLLTTIGIKEAMSAETGVDTCKYTPQVGVLSGDYDPVPLTPPTITKATLTFAFPSGAPTTTVILRNPQFGNLDTLTVNRVNRESRGGTLLVFADRIWPKSQRLEFSIPNLKGDQVTALETFLDLSLGLPIDVTDWHGRSFTGVILNNPEVVQVSRTAFAVDFSFEVLP
jgi:hypothetical protein